jgi:hypothetical protein
VNPILKRIIEFRGEPIPVDTRDPKVYVRYIALTNLTFTHTGTFIMCLHYASRLLLIINQLTMLIEAATYLEPYEVPSNGDWTIHRSGTVYFETAQHCAVHNW